MSRKKPSSKPDPPGKKDTALVLVAAENSLETLPPATDHPLKIEEPSSEKDPSTTIPEPQTEQMEVHHHPEVEKKGLKEYLLEGLMIFLAVFMGFIAENIREDYVEHKKAQSYAITMAADLASDTTQLKDYILYYTLAKKNTDTLMKLTAGLDIKKVSTGKLYLYGLWAGGQRIFKANDATFQQMKSTGALQFFESPIAREAGEYDRWCRYMQSLDEMDEAVYVEVRKLRSQIFEFQYNNNAADLWTKIAPNHMNSTKAADIASRDSFIKINPPLLSYDKSIFNQYLELTRSRYMVRKLIVVDSVLTHATRLLTDIKKSYDIK